MSLKLRLFFVFDEKYDHKNNETYQKNDKIYVKVLDKCFVHLKMKILFCTDTLCFVVCKLKNIIKFTRKL